MLAGAYQQYQNNAVMTASGAELTLMLYNGAIKFINQGIESIEKENLAAAHTSIMKAQRIIEELRATLDEKYDVAKQMDTLYIFINELLVQANIKKDITQLEEARGLVREFRDMWQEVIKAAK